MPLPVIRVDHFLKLPRRAPLQLHRLILETYLVEPLAVSWTMKHYPRSFDGPRLRPVNQENLSTFSGAILHAGYQLDTFLGTASSKIAFGQMCVGLTRNALCIGPFETCRTAAILTAVRRYRRYQRKLHVQRSRRAFHWEV